MIVPDHTHPIGPHLVQHARSHLPSADAADRLISLLSLMVDPVRPRSIYALDVGDEFSVGDFAVALAGDFPAPLGDDSLHQFVMITHPTDGDRTGEGVDIGMES